MLQKDTFSVQLEIRHDQACPDKKESNFIWHFKLEIYFKPCVIRPGLIQLCSSKLLKKSEKLGELTE